MCTYVHAHVWTNIYVYAHIYIICVYLFIYMYRVICTQTRRNRDVSGFGFSQPIFAGTYDEDPSFPSPRGTCHGERSKCGVPGQGLRLSKVVQCTKKIFKLSGERLRLCHGFGQRSAGDTLVVSCSGGYGIYTASSIFFQSELSCMKQRHGQMFSVSGRLNLTLLP